MKDKLLNFKDDIVRKITENKKISAIAAIAVVVVVVAIVVAVASFGGGSKSDNIFDKADSEQLKNTDVESGDDKNKDNGLKDKSETEKAGIGSDGASQTNGETDKNEAAGSENGTNGSENNNGSSNTNGQNNGQTNGNGNAQSGNSQAGGADTGNVSGSGSGNDVNSTNNNANVNTGNTSVNNNTNNNANSSAGNNSNNTNSSTGNNTTSASGNKSPQPTGTSSGNDTPQANQETIYNQLFDINNKVTITLDISDSELQKLQNDYKKYGSGKSPIYRRVTKMTVTINNTSYEMYDVGVRMKGNTSRCDVYNNNNIDDRNLIHLRLSFDEAFDNTEYYGSEALSWSEAARKERKARTFATLDGLELKWNRNFDGTYVANYYANQMYRAFGVYAQNTSLANIRFGGYNYGVYTIYEPVDKKFLKRYIPEASDGDLYKCGWGGGKGASYLTDTLSSIGVSTPYQSFTYDLKTNKTSSNHSSLKNLINKLNSSPSSFGNLVDVDNWINFVAVSYFTGNPDDLRNNFNNHYVYFKNGKAVFIPYDYDRCFGIVTESNEDMTTFSPYADNTALQGSQRNPLYLNSVTGRSNTYTTQYTNALKNVAQSGWLNYSNYQNYYNIARNNYSSVAIPDSNVHVYVKPFGSSSGRVHDSSKLGFNENNGYNTSVSTYMTKIFNRYNEAISKW